MDPEIGFWVIGTMAVQWREFLREFRVEAVRLIKGGGAPMAQAHRDPDVQENVPRKWALGLVADPGRAFWPLTLPDARAGPTLQMG